MSYQTNPFACAFPSFDVDADLLRDTMARLRRENKDLKIDNKELEIDRDEIYERLSKAEDDLVESWMSQKKALIEKNQIREKNQLLEKEIEYLTDEIRRQRKFVEQKNVFITELLSNKCSTVDVSTSCPELKCENNSDTESETEALNAKEPSQISNIVSLHSQFLRRSKAEQWEAAWNNDENIILCEPKNNTKIYDEEIICSDKESSVDSDKESSVGSDKESSVDSGVEADCDMDEIVKENVNQIIESVLNDDDDEWTDEDWGDEWGEYIVNSLES